MDHVSIPVSQYKQSAAFYQELLKVLDFEKDLYFEQEGQWKCGSFKKSDGHRRFAVWLSSGPDDFGPSSEVPASTATESMPVAKKYGDIPGMHFCFLATSKEQVEQWHAKGLSLGATCNGPPGYRTHYHAGYYGAFLIDPYDLWRLEVVFHDPSKAA